MALPVPVETNDTQDMQAAFKDAKREEQSIFDLRLDHTDLGKPESLRYNVLVWVLNEKYDKAIEALKNFGESESPYPDFKQKTGRFIAHCIDLVYAIKAKRNFPGMNSLTRSKQQELREKFKTHLRELQNSLTRVEVIRHDLQIKDARSTIYIVKALWYAGFSILLLAFCLELFNGLAENSINVSIDAADSGADWLFRLIGM